MPLVNVFAAKDTVDANRRQAITQQLYADFLEMEGVPDSEFARSISWVLWHEVDEWFIGDERIRAGDQPRYLVRVELPAAALEAAALKDDSIRGRLVEQVTAAFAKADDDPDRLTRESAAWVIIDEVPEGNWGSHGRVIRFEDILALLGVKTG